MTNITSERVIGLSKNPLKFYNDVDLETVQIPDEPMDFREFMDLDKQIDLLESVQEPIMVTNHWVVKEYEGGN